MRRLLLTLFVTAGLTGVATAQPQPGAAPGASRPNYSPYLNLLRGGNPTLNYFGLVKPEFQLRQQANQLQQQVTANAQAIQQNSSAITGAGDENLPITGRGATFNFTSHYFNNFPVGGSGAGGPSIGRVNSPATMSGINRFAGPAGSRPNIGVAPQAGSGRGRR